MKTFGKSGCKLVVVATPIGNLNDMAPRAREALATADVIAAEDTRRTGQLLTLLGIGDKRLVSCFKDNEQARVEDFEGLWKQGKTVALVSDSGSPAISDPGARVVRAARELGVPVDVLPGPCAAILAVAGSGLNVVHGGAFVMHGFLPRKAGERAKVLARLARYPEALVFYESPNRIVEALEEMEGVFGNRQAWLARELTKMHEEWLGATLAEVRDALAGRETVKGEITLVVAGVGDEVAVGEVSDADIKERLAAGEGTRVVADWVADITGTSRREAYARVCGLKG